MDRLAFFSKKIFTLKVLHLFLGRIAYPPNKKDPGKLVTITISSIFFYFFKADKLVFKSCFQIKALWATEEANRFSTKVE